MYKCKQCDKEYDSLKKLNNHITAKIRKGLHINDKEKWIIADNKYKCPYCDLIFSKMGIDTHIWRIHDEVGQLHKNKISRKGLPAWNKGLTKDTSAGIRKMIVNLKLKFKSGELKPSFLGKKHTAETKLKLSTSGGYRKGSGRGKSGWYKGYWCDSSWELAWVIYNIDHEIKFKRNKKYFLYEYEGKTYKYFPDFIIEDQYIEIKGYETKHTLAKISSCPNLIVLKKLEMTPILEYVKEKYGKNFIELYESKAE